MQRNSNENLYEVEKCMQSSSKVSMDADITDDERNEKPVAKERELPWRTNGIILKKDTTSGRNNSRTQQLQLTANDKAKVTPLTHLLLYSDDMRISKILRRLISETNPAASVDLCKKLEVAVQTQSNASYICRSFEFLLENMIAILKQSPIETLEQASVVLGLIGYINRTDFQIYKSYLTRAYQSSRSIQRYIMMALKTTMSCDAVNLDLAIYSKHLLSVLKDYLENAEKTEIFIAVSDTIAEFSKNYVRTFESHFTDIVDIVVGWHLEIDQPQSLKLHCSSVLQQFSQYFLKELDFTLGLLGQFLEDIVTFGEDVATESNSQKTKQKAELRVGSFVGAFTSILKSLATKNEFLAFHSEQNILNDAVTVIIKAAEQIFLGGIMSEETILNINDFLCLILTNDFDAANLINIEEIVELQLKHLPTFNPQQKLSVLYLILCVVRLMRTQLPCSMVTVIFRTENNALNDVKLTSDCRLHKLLLKIYQEVLMIKNVPLLQEAYKHVTLHVDDSIQALKTSVRSHLTQRNCAESILNFYLSALSALATQTSSIIGMYALYPSILELLVVNCEAANMSLWSQHATLHSALLNVLVVHCQKNHNYRQSARLLNEDVIAKHALDEKSSRSSENLSMILKFLADILGCFKDVNSDNLSLILNWTKYLLQDCVGNAHILKNNVDFQNICKALTQSAIKLPMESAGCLNVLLKYSAVNSDVLGLIRDTALQMLDTLDPLIIEAYTAIYARLPLGVCLAKEVIGGTEIPTKAFELEHWYKSTSNFAPLSSNFFKPFLESMQAGNKTDTTLDQLVYKFFSKCWTLQLRDNAVEYQKIACNNSEMLASWLQYEAARYCVRNKLRTTIGKPQETFLAIEVLIMEYARLLNMKDNGANVNASTMPLKNSMLMQKNIRMLLGFLENLEKHIYNAAEGTAFAIQPPEKPSKTFFRINAHTCNEWFKRIRASVNLIALHSMEPHMVVRYAENTLKMDKLNDFAMDRTITVMARALIACGEPDTLMGLYIWYKRSTGKDYLWIQHAMEQAAGCREIAADGYEIILKKNDDELDVSVKEFIFDQLLDCWYYTGQWSKMRQLFKRYKAPKETTMTNLLNMRSDEHLNLIETLYYGQDEGHTSNEAAKAVLDLMEWPSGLSQSNEQVSEKFSYYNILQKLEDSCIIQTQKFGKSKILQHMQQVVHEGFQEGMRHSAISEGNKQQTEFVIVNHVLQKVMDSEYDSSLATLDCNDIVQDTTVLTKCLLWTLLFNERTHNASNKHHSLYLDIAASARRDGNNKFCNSMLQRFFALKGFSEPLLNISEKLQSNCYIVDVADADLLRGFSELAKCLYASSTSHQLNALNLASIYCMQIIQQVHQYPHLHYPESSANMLLNIADWLMVRGSATGTLSRQVQQLLNKLPDIAVSVTDENTNAIIPSLEMSIGKLLHASTYQQSDSGDAWFAFGNWCYRWGKKLVEAKNAENSTLKGTLSQRDLIAIKDLLGGDVSEAMINQLVDILNSHHLNIYDGVEDIETNEASSTELIENELRKLDILADRPVEDIASIVEIWRVAHKSVYAYYETATKAYFKYLLIETLQSETKTKLTHDGGDGTFVTATLRLLRLVVKHAIGLQEVLEDGFRTTPLRPWKSIIPQLFSRLNHHEPYVRKSVSELLCRLAEDRPHLVIFPAVVGANQELKGLKQQSKNEDTNLSTTNQKSKTLSTCFNSLLLTLSKQAPEKVLHVQLLIKELKRIALLWEEYWMHSLTQLYGEYSNMFSALEMETKNSSDSEFERISAKYKILFQHLVMDLETIASVTEKEAETNYERIFQERYNQFINNIITDLKKPVNKHNPCDGWHRIKQLYTIFQQRSIRGTASTMKVSELSPVLANMQNTSISMPGVDTFETNSIYIKSVDSTVYILPTKTKPKKLAFFGSDGRRYTYLFKGLEDLHLDERIMQFLSISNAMLARTCEAVCSRRVFRAHHYSVIPLGPQSGLISWVDGVTPLFSIYKKWQQRDTALKQQQKERPTTNKNKANSELSLIPPATRPSELYYNKLSPLLAEQNIKVTDPRKQWPLDTLRRVLEELSQETPKDLFSKELWCQALNAAEWRKSVRMYSISVAVMSVIGYVIGLGDRHLDNVLIKLSTGEIVHIDYNVCFEKGKTLRVPEKVPFRMTPNVVDALGITGIEGTFRMGCEYVLKTLRKERETLLTLLEAFVYDPLVDWTINDDGSTTTLRTTSAHLAVLSIAALNHSSPVAKDVSKNSKNMDTLMERKTNMQVSRPTIEVRFNDIKPYWTEYKDEIVGKLEQLKLDISNLIAVRQDIQLAEQERDSLTKQLAMIRELEALGSAMGSHALNTVTQRYNAARRDAEAFNVLKQSIEKYHNDLKKLLSIYFKHLIAASATDKVKSLQEKVSDEDRLVCSNEFQILRELMQQTGQMELYEKCEFVRKEMDNTLFQASHCAMDCLDFMLQYANVMQFYPLFRLKQNRLLKYEEWYAKLLEGQDIAELKEDMNQCFDAGNEVIDGAKERALEYSKAMEKVWIELNFDLHKSVNAINEHKQTEIAPVDVAICSLQNFVVISPGPHTHTQALRCCMLRTLAKASDDFLQLEETALTSGDIEILELQIDFIDIALSMCQAAFSECAHKDFRLEQLLNSTPIQVLNFTLHALYVVKASFDVMFPERIVRLFMLDNIPEVQAALAAVCTTSYASSECWQSAVDVHCRNTLCEVLLEDIVNLFDDFEAQLPHLHQLARECLDQLPDCNIKQFMTTRNTIPTFKPDNSLKCEAIAKVFCAARDHVKAINDNNTDNIYDLRVITAPVSEYVERLQQTFLGGLTSLFVRLMQTNFGAAEHSSPVKDDITMGTSAALCENLLASLQHTSSFKRHQQSVMRHSKWVDHYTLVASAHYWANEPLLRDTQHMFGHVIYKEKLLNSLQCSSQALNVWKHTIVKIQDDIEEHTALIKQRLSWAAEVAQKLLPLQDSFVELVKAQKKRQSFYLELSKDLVDYSSALLQYEMVLGGNTAGTDNAFANVVEQWQDAYENVRQSDATITPVEHAIVQLLNPEGKIDQSWISNISELLDEMTFAVQRKLANLERQEHTVCESLHAGGQLLQPLMESTLRNDIRHLLKMIFKTDKTGRPVNAEATKHAARARELQVLLKLFFTKLYELQAKLLSRDFSEPSLPLLKAKITEVMSACEHNYSALLEMMARIIQSHAPNLTSKSPLRSGNSPLDNPLGNTSWNMESSAANIIDKKVCEQKRNAYAVSVWKRIRMKLEGRDPDPNRRSTVHEQVEFIIGEAMNPDNLAVLYEGWTPWV